MKWHDTCLHMCAQMFTDPASPFPNLTTHEEKTVEQTSIDDIIFICFNIEGLVYCAFGLHGLDVGPGFLHLPKKLDQEWLASLTLE